MARVHDYGYHVTKWAIFGPVREAAERKVYFVAYADIWPFGHFHGRGVMYIKHYNTEFKFLITAV